MTATGLPGIRRRWERQLLRLSGTLDGEKADRLLPWLLGGITFALLVALDAAAIRSLDGGSGLGPWLQAAWRRQHGWEGSAVGGIDPAHGSWSFVAEPVLWVTRFVPPEAVFTTVQAAAIALAVVPLWRLARDDAHLRVGASVVVCVAFVLAPTLHRTNLSAFHPEAIALPALLWAYLLARHERWRGYAVLVLVVLACRADLGLTVVALGLVLATQGRRVQGAATAAAGLAWSIVAVVVLDPAVPDESLTPAGEFVARATTPLAVLPRLLTHPISEARELLAEPSVLFLVVVLAPLLFLPLVSPRKMFVALPALALAMIADRSVQRVAQEGVLDLSPAAAHIAPALAFVFVALVYALERIGQLSVTRVNVDRRVLIALLAGATLFFVTEAPSSPYRQPWAWGSRDVVDGARLQAADRIGPQQAVGVSPTATVLVAERAHLVELPPDPIDFTTERVGAVTREVEVVLLDTAEVDGPEGEPVWTEQRRRRVLLRFEARGFRPVFEAQDVFVLERQS
jgi:uncharacterized membrane protein